MIIIDYGMGNVGSISNMLRHISVAHSIESQSREKIINAKGLILPGVGNFSKAMSILSETGMDDIIREAVLVKKVPILGICLGMQLMCKYSEEGNREGLGLIDGNVRRFPQFESGSLKVPHMGWSYVDAERDVDLIRDLPDNPRFYFVHSYFVECMSSEDILFTCTHGITFTAAFLNGNVFGCQFHPEKSHRFGIKLFRNFAEWCE